MIGFAGTVKVVTTGAPVSGLILAEACRGDSGTTADRGEIALVQTAMSMATEGRVSHRTTSATRPPSA